MQKVVSFSAVFLSIFLVPAMGALHAQKAFEGTIIWDMSIPQMGDEEKHAMKVNIKGDKTETDIDLGARGIAKTYVDRSVRKEYMVLGDSKSGRVVDLPSDSAINGNGFAVDLKATGNKETIAGHKAEEYTFISGHTDVSVWACFGFPKNLCQKAERIMSGQQDNRIQNVFRQLSKKGLFPVKVVASQQGKVAMSMEFVKYEQKSLDGALFVPPQDVKYDAPPQMGGSSVN